MRRCGRCTESAKLATTHRRTKSMSVKENPLPASLFLPFYVFRIEKGYTRVRFAFLLSLERFFFRFHCSNKREQKIHKKKENKRGQFVDQNFLSSFSVVINLDLLETFIRVVCFYRTLVAKLISFFLHYPSSNSCRHVYREWLTCSRNRDTEIHSNKGRLTRCYG